MRISVVTVFLFLMISALSSAAGYSYGCDLPHEYVSDHEAHCPELVEAAGFGTSCYVDLCAPANLLDYAAETCDESDGSLATDGPEGIFLNDHQDEHSAYPACGWKVLPIRRQPGFLQIAAPLCSVRPGSIYPPPQS